MPHHRWELSPEPSLMISGMKYRFSALLTLLTVGATSPTGLAVAARPVQVASSWTVGRAEAQITQHPPRLWVAKGYSVVNATCDGVPTTSKAGRTRRQLSPRRRTLYSAFSCEITLVVSTGPCAGAGVYVCIMGYESRALMRTLHVIDRTRYALYRT